MNVKIEDSNRQEGIDWSIPQLLIDKSTGLLILSNGKCSDVRSFSGTNISNGDHSQYWLKESFTLFNGTITLSND